MKKILLLLTIIAFVACNEDKNEPKVESMTTKNDSAMKNVSYPYEMMYSSQFEMGDPKHSQTVLNIWKAWDKGDLSSVKDWFADSVEIHTSDGYVIKGSRDSVLKSSQDYRSSYKSVSSTVDAVLSTRSTDKKEDWVCVWGKEVHTDSKNVTDSVYLQETCRINKDGKIDFMMQYARSPRSPQQ